MILQALYEYYQRKANDQESTIAPEGWEWKEIPFLILINNQGKFIQLIDTRQSIEGKLKAKIFLLPKGIGRSGPNAWKVANLLWDHYGYVLNVSKKDEPQEKEMSSKQFNSFVNSIKRLPDEIKNDARVNAVLSFYDKKEYLQVIKDENWSECRKIAGCNMTFCVNESANIIFNSRLLEQHINSRVNFDPESEYDEEDNATNDSLSEGVCLITGEKDIIKRKHTRTPINKDTKSLVAIQKNSGYDSYGKQQAFNAPVGRKAEFAYTTALNTILKNRDNRLGVGDATTIFWSEQKSENIGYNLENDFKWFIEDSPKDDPDRGIKAVKSLYEAIHSGKLPFNTDDRFYVLGLSPNSARISIRFWKTGTIKEFSENIVKHFQDLEIIRGPKDREYISINQLLRSIALKYEMRNVPPNLAGKVVMSILDGVPYPDILLNLCINRIRAERLVTRTRAAILKAYINRYVRFYNKHEKEVGMSLDRAKKNTGYRLGRLFAVIEKIDEEGGSGTIRERFYGAASTSPGIVFSRLLTLKNHHLAKLENIGRRVNFEKEIGEICEEIDDFPSHLMINEQAQFAIGYYHQRQDFFKQRSENSPK